MEKTTKKKNPKLKLVISIMLAAALFLAELYIMINLSNQVAILIGIAVFILIALYFVVDAVLDYINEKSVLEHEQYDNIYRSERASYMLLKKNIDELSKQIKKLENGSNKGSADSAEIIRAQKAIAKVTMAKTKETQDRLFMEINSIEASLKDKVKELAIRLSGFQEEIERLADHIAKINKEAIQQVAMGGVMRYEALAEEKINEVDDILEDIFGDDILGENLEDTFNENELESEPEPEVEPIPAAPAPTDNGGKMNQDDIAALIASMSGGSSEPEPAPEPEPVPATPAPSDNGGKMNQDDIAALIASMSGGSSEPEPVPEPIPAAPAPSDNGGKMNQDDIAALIASMTGGDVEPEPIPEPTPLPLDDNPNRMMTPEEIAALLESM